MGVESFYRVYAGPCFNFKFVQGVFPFNIPVNPAEIRWANH